MNKLNFKLETLLFILLFYGIATAQEYYYQDYIKSSNHQSRREYDAFDENGNPLNRTKEVVFIFIDYPDGRFIHNGIRKQPETSSELLQVENLDAVGELGLTNAWSPIQNQNNPNLYVNAYKYKWSDRWNMLFSTGGIYQGNAHPDNNSHNSYSNLSKEAYGSFKEYWTEVSNSKYEIIPALTHTDETDIMYRTGIANNIKTVNASGLFKA